MAPWWPTAGWFRVERGNRITRQMTQLPSGENRGGESEPDPLGFGFVVSSVGDGGSALGWEVAGRSLIMRSAMLCVRSSTACDPLSSSVAGVLLGLATMNGVMPSGGPANRPRSTCVLGYTEWWQRRPG
jgi:hypothetical protein